MRITEAQSAWGRTPSDRSHIPQSLRARRGCVSSKKRTSVSQEHLQSLSQRDLQEKPAAHVMAGAPAATLECEDTLKLEATYCRQWTKKLYLAWILP